MVADIDCLAVTHHGMRVVPHKWPLDLRIDAYGQPIDIRLGRRPPTATFCAVRACDRNAGCIALSFATSTGNPRMNGADRGSDGEIHSSGFGCGQGAAEATREVAQPIEGVGRKHFVRAPPPPVAVGAAGQIHPRLIAEIKNILQWSHSEGGRRRPCQLHLERSEQRVVVEPVGLALAELIKSVPQVGAPPSSEIAPGGLEKPTLERHHHDHSSERSPAACV